MKTHSMSLVRASKAAVVADWHGSRYAPFALILLVITSLATASFYVGQPTLPEFSYDTAGYVQVTHQILTNGNFVDAWRQPGYPSLMALVFVVAGINNFFAVAVVQGILFVLATLEVYALTALLFRKTWVAFLVGVLVGTNTYLLSFVKPIIVEGYALWLTVSLALAVVLWIKTGRPGYFWLVTLFTLVLFMTRPEWIFLPLPLFAYLLFIARRRGTLRRFLPHTLFAAVLLYSVLGLYIYVNATANDFAGVTYNQRVNLFGKVMQYHMQNEAPAEYAQVAQVVNAYVASGGDNPYALALSYPALAQDHWALAGNYANAVVRGHPFEFLAKSVVVFFTSSIQYRAFSQIDTGGPVAQPPFKLEVSLSAYIARTYQFFPLFALFWIALAFWRKKARLEIVETMGAVVLLVLYELILVTIGAYTNYDYARLHIPFDPLMIIVIWGTLLASIPLWEGALVRLRLTGQATLWVWGGIVLVSVLGSMALSWASFGISGAFNPQTWLVVRLVVSHLPRLLTVLLLAALITFLGYRAARRQRLTAVESKESVEALMSLNTEAAPKVESKRE